MMSIEKIFELIKLRSLAGQKILSGNVKSIRNLRKEMAKEKVKK
ncbi:MAG: hypothetical protein QW483_02840 [Nanopusillaceae archaeon]